MYYTIFRWLLLAFTSSATNYNGQKVYMCMCESSKLEPLVKHYICFPRFNLGRFATEWRPISGSHTHTHKTKTLYSAKGKKGMRDRKWEREYQMYEQLNRISVDSFPIIANFFHMFHQLIRTFFACSHIESTFSFLFMCVFVCWTWRMRCETDANPTIQSN